MDMLAQSQAYTLPHAAGKTAKSIGEAMPPMIPARLPCFTLEDTPELARNPNFLGREDTLNAMRHILLPYRQGSTSFEIDSLKQLALCGMGGIGKTEIALEFAHRQRRKYDAVFWARADTIANLDKSFWHLSDRLGLLDYSRQPKFTTGTDALGSWLSNPWKFEAGKGRSPISRWVRATWLLILDGADDLSTIWHLRQLKFGSVLITSRDPTAKTILSTVSAGLHLECLHNAEGAALLKRLTKRTENSDADAKFLSSLLGGLPLAISQIASVSVFQDLDLSELCELYKQRQNHAVLHNTSGLNFSAYPFTVATVWHLETLSLEAKTFLDVLSLMRDTQIPQQLLIDFDHDHAVPYFPCGLESVDKARNELMQSSLIQWDTPEIDIKLHRTVQDAVIAKLSHEQFDATFSFVVFLVWFRWPSSLPRASCGLHPKTSNQRHLVTRWSWCASLFLHVARLRELWEHTNKISMTTRMLFVALLNEAAWYQHERGSNGEVPGLLGLSEKVCNSIEHPNKDSLLVDVNFFLGAIAADTNQHELSWRHRQASTQIQLKISQELGLADERLVVSWIEFAASGIQDRSYERAITILELAQDFRKRFLVSKPRIKMSGKGSATLQQEEDSENGLATYIPSELEAYLGLAYLMQGKLDESELVLTEALDRRQRILGMHDVESYRTGLFLHALGNLRAAQGRMGESQWYHKEAWDHYQSTVGPQDPRSADASHKLAEHHLHMGHYGEAILQANPNCVLDSNTCKEAIKVWKAWSQAYKPRIARTTFLQATIYQVKKSMRSAREYRRKAFELRRGWLADQGLQHAGVGMSAKDFDEMVPFWSR
ncbi:MAG: hypothetical protein Q9170_002910 [Blastenia crenularia]